MIERVVIPAAGLGTRLLSATKEQPKEMLPVFARGKDGTPCLKPLVQIIFEDLFDIGARTFCLVVGRGKRAIEDHFTPHRNFLQYLNSRGKNSQAIELETFYRRIEGSTILWMNQPEPKGFGDAVLQAQLAITREPFVVHAGDTTIISKTTNILERLVAEHRRSSADATLTLQEIDDPRGYGVAEVTGTGTGGLRVKRVTEKPAKPRSNLAIMPVYVFNLTIFDSLRDISPDKSGELQLTDAIQNLIETGSVVKGIKLRKEDIRLDIGTPETYWQALSLSYKHATST